MNINDRNYFKNKLLNEKRKAERLIHDMEENDTINTNMGLEDELSNYDNHPADSGGNLYEKEKGMALKEHEISIIKKIDDALKGIEAGTYGKCKSCGKDIIKQRLEFLPYAQYCTKCEEKINNIMNDRYNNRPVEESVLETTFKYGFNDYKDNVEFDAEDSYQCVERFNQSYDINSYKNYYEEIDVNEIKEDTGYVESIERISNEQYKNQLPD